MRIALDTNVILDAAADRAPFAEEAQAILLMVSEDRVTGLVNASSITDIYFVARRTLPESAAREIIRSLLQSLEVVEVGDSDCSNALFLPMSDFEDALLATCAEKAGADYIVSRDAEFLRSASPVPVISLKDFLQKISA
jgi:predicted nucleic acid-binding protein